jgi:hypothetical protein
MCSRILRSEQAVAIPENWLSGDTELERIPPSREAVRIQKSCLSGTGHDQVGVGPSGESSVGNENARYIEPDILAESGERMDQGNIDVADKARKMKAGYLQLKACRRLQERDHIDMHQGGPERDDIELPVRGIGFDLPVSPQIVGGNGIRLGGNSLGCESGGSGDGVRAG